MATKKAKESLCWSCARAAGGYGCPWVDSRPSGETPVPGWRATKMPRRWRGQQQGSGYLVTKCPLFAADGTLPKADRLSADVKQHSSSLAMCKSMWGAYKG